MELRCNEECRGFDCMEKEIVDTIETVVDVFERFFYFHTRAWAGELLRSNSETEAEENMRERHNIVRAE